MTEFKGTPGRFTTDGDQVYSEYEDANGGFLIARTFGDDAIANARLTSAAPDLLKALQDMLFGWRYIRSQNGDLYGVGWDRAERAATAAISKALGQ